MRARSGKPSKAAAAALRAEVLATARTMARLHLAPGRSGNVSARCGDGMLITPSGLPYEDVTPADIVHVAADGSPEPGALKPSSEWRFHLAAYAARPDCHAVVHTHSLYCVALACTGRAIPAFHYMVAAAGGTDIPIVPYASFGTPELAGNVAAGLAQRDACLMANHGQIAIGRTLGAALELAENVETLAAQYVLALSIGKPVLLSAAEMADVLQRFKSYGQNAQTSPAKPARKVVR